jgi:hypothetical protein
MGNQGHSKAFDLPDPTKASAADACSTRLQVRRGHAPAVHGRRVRRGGAWREPLQGGGGGTGGAATVVGKRRGGAATGGCGGTGCGGCSTTPQFDMTTVVRLHFQERPRARGCIPTPMSAWAMSALLCTFEMKRRNASHSRSLRFKRTFSLRVANS